MATKLKKTNLVKAFVKTKLGYHLDKEISKGDFEWEYKFYGKESDDAWHPSSHCIQSPAELYHIARGDLDAFAGPSPYKTFQVGHFWHQYLQKVVQRLEFCGPDDIERRGWKLVDGKLDAMEGRLHKDTEDPNVIEIAPFHWVTGSADIAPCEIPGHGPYLIDFKTMGSFAFKPNTPPGDFLTKWECQLNVYMDFFDLEKALIVGINKDSPHEFKEFEFHRNQELIDALYYKWRLVSECLDKEVEPPVDEVVELPTKGPVNI